MSSTRLDKPGKGLRKNLDANEVQTMELSGMQGKSEDKGEGNHRERVFNSRAFLLHNTHLVKQGVAYDSGCGLCTQGMDAVVTTFEAETRRPGLVQSDRGDEEGAASSPPDSGWHWNTATMSWEDGKQ